MTAPPLESAEAASDAQARLGRERLTLLYDTNQPTVVAGLLIALLFGWLFWPLVDHYLVLAWIGAIVVTQLARLLLIQAYRRALQDHEPLNPDVWARRQTLIHGAIGLAWGLGAAAVIPQVSITHQAIILMFFGGAATAGIFVAMHLPAYLAYMATALIPCVASMAVYASGDGKVIALMLLLYMIVAVLIGRQIRGLTDRILQLRLDNEQLVDELRQLAATDPLTGIANRREFLRRAGELLHRAQESGAPAALLILDLDRFKAINDTYGHAVGDQALRSATDAALRILRSNDLIGRIGGEEFAVLLGRSGMDEARQIAERLRAEISSVDVGPELASVTTSVGVAGADEHDFDLLEMLKAADECLYSAKAAGGDRVVTAA